MVFVFWEYYIIIRTWQIKSVCTLKKNNKINLKKKNHTKTALCGVCPEVCICIYFWCRLLTGDFQLSFLRRFGKVIKFAVSFRVTLLVRWHYIQYTYYGFFFFLNPENFFLTGSSSSRYIIYYSICCRKIHPYIPRPRVPNSVTRLLSFLVFVLPMPGTATSSRRTYSFPLVCFLYYFPSTHATRHW